MLVASRVAWKRMSILFLFAWLGLASSARLPQNPPSPPPDDNGNSTDGVAIETSAAYSTTSIAALTTTPAPQAAPCSAQYADSTRLPGEDFCGSTQDRKTCKNIDGNEGLGPYPPAEYKERCTWDMSCGRSRSSMPVPACMATFPMTLTDAMAGCFATGCACNELDCKIKCENPCYPLLSCDESVTPPICWCLPPAGWDANRGPGMTTTNGSISTGGSRPPPTTPAPESAPNPVEIKTANGMYPAY